ncbi:hypothetical protein LINGRAHAP2_LOCUS9165 [Linum grandiflorum]
MMDTLRADKSKDGVEKETERRVVKWLQMKRDMIRYIIAREGNFLTVATSIHAGNSSSPKSHQLIRHSVQVIAWCLVRIIPVHDNIALVFSWMLMRSEVCYLSLYLSRLQKDSSDQKTSIGGVKYSDSHSSNAALFNLNYGIPSQERGRKGTLTVSSATSGRKRALTAFELGVLI